MTPEQLASLGRLETLCYIMAGVNGAAIAYMVFALGLMAYMRYKTEVTNRKAFAKHLEAPAVKTPIGVVWSAPYHLAKPPTQV